MPGLDRSGQGAGPRPRDCLVHTLSVASKYGSLTGPWHSVRARASSLIHSSAAATGQAASLAW
jgi:hypothetical protein